jgi:hypothetical protein
VDGKCNGGLENQLIKHWGWMVPFQEYCHKGRDVNQQYTGNAWTGRFAGAQFEGINVETSISF